MQQVETIPEVVADLAAELGISDKIEAIFELTQQMFPGPVSLETGYDPEWPDDRWIAFNVESAESFSQIIQQELDWSRRIAPLLNHRRDAVSLFVMPRKRR